MGEGEPRQIGQYTISRELGRGGMGVVYLGRDERLDREVAVKVLPSDVASSSERISRLMREAKTLASLNHPNVLTVHDVGSEGETAYLVTELLEGSTLRERLDSSPLSWRKSVEIAIAIAHGLAAGHERGITHRDLKPENVFLTRSGVVKILDFGLARQVGEGEGAQQTQIPTQTHATQAGAVMGTVGYMSPEQVRGEPADARSDIFALGCVLHEMLAGERAFARGSSAESMAAILKEAPSSFEPGTGVPIELERIVMRCLEKEASERFQSARDLAFALESSLNDSSATRGHAIPAEAPGASSSRTGKLVALGVIVVAATIIGGLLVWSPWSASPATSGTIDSLVVLPFETPSDDPDSAFLGEGIAENLINTLSEIESLRVIPRSTAFRYASLNATPAQISRDLGVRGVVMGRVVRREQRVVISAELIDARADRQLWGQRYSRRRGDLMSLEQEIVQELTSALQVELSQAAPPQRQHTVSADAHLAYMEARFWMAKRSPEGFRRALELCDRAISLDGSFALPHALRGQVYLLMGIYTSPALEVIPRARQAAERALELDPGNIAARNTLAGILGFSDWDFVESERKFREIIELASRNPTAHHWYAVSLIAMQRWDDAQREIDRARRLDPGGLILMRDAIAVVRWQGDFDTALRRAQRAVELDPNFPMLRIELGWAYIGVGDHARGIEHLRRAVADESLNMRYQGELGIALGVTGDTTGARAELSRLKQMAETHYVFPSVLAFLHASIGELDECFDLLHQAVDERDDFLAFIRNVPQGLDAMRADPRYQVILDRIGFGPDR